MNFDVWMKIWSTIRLVLKKNDNSCKRITLYLNQCRYVCHVGLNELQIITIELAQWLYLVKKHYNIMYFAAYDKNIIKWAKSL